MSWNTQSICSTVDTPKYVPPPMETVASEIGCPPYRLAKSTGKN